MASPPSTGISLDSLDHLHIALCKHALVTQTTSGVDAKHDAVFGTALFCLNLLRELITCGVRSTLGRMALRTILESQITLAYLIKKNDPSLWLSHRVYGAGQAKLSFLKLDGDEALPEYVSLETLRALANEDQWQEFLNIDLGHWDKTNLRKMSEVADLKDMYDRYYPWPSAFVHGHWGAVRDTVFTTCLNPLHRLHRVPRLNARIQNEVLTDASTLIDQVLTLVNQCYPSFSMRLRDMLNLPGSVEA